MQGLRTWAKEPLRAGHRAMTWRAKASWEGVGILSFTWYVYTIRYIHAKSKKRLGFPQKPSGLDPFTVSRPRRPVTFYFPATVGLLPQPSAPPRTLALACSQESGIL